MIGQNGSDVTLNCTRLPGAWWAHEATRKQYQSSPAVRCPVVITNFLFLLCAPALEWINPGGRPAFLDEPAGVGIIQSDMTTKESHKPTGTTPPESIEAGSGSPGQARILPWARFLPAWTQSFWFGLAMALIARYLAYSVMVFLSLMAEARPAPHLPDAILDMVSYHPLLDRYNYWIWLGCYIPPALVLALRHPWVFIRFLYAGAIISVLRGVTILMTGLGPVHGPDVNAGMTFQDVVTAWKQFVDPISALLSNQANIHLTKDLFFSGHTATTFLLVCYTWRDKALRWWTLAGHLFVVWVVFASHLHYSIDVAGAYAMTFSIYALLEWHPKGREVIHVSNRDDSKRGTAEATHDR